MKLRKIASLALTAALSVTLLAGCGINKNATAITYKLDGKTQKVSLGLVNFMCRFQQASSDDMMNTIASMYGYDEETIWEQDLYGSGSTQQEYTKDSVVETLHEMITLRDHASEYDVSLTDEEKETITETAKTFLDANSKEARREMSATQEIVEEVLTLYTLHVKVEDAIKATADTEVSDEEANMRAYTMLSVDTAGYYDDDNEYVEYSDDEADALAATMEEIAKHLADGATLEEEAEEHSLSDDLTTGTYDADDDSLDEAVKTALDDLKEGKTSELIHEDESTTYTFVRIDSDTDEEATEQNRQDIVEQRQSDLLEETLSGWQENDKWKVKEKQLAKITFKNRFTQEDSETEETESVSDDTQAQESAASGTETAGTGTTEAAAETIDGTEQ